MLHLSEIKILNLTVADLQNRMNNATPDNRFSHQIGQHTPTSPVSSYQTPEYRLNRQKAMFGDTSAANISQIGTENHMGGPPTKSLYESLETRPSIGSHCTSNIHNHSMSHNQSRLIAGKKTFTKSSLELFEFF